MFPVDYQYRMPAEWEPHARTLISWPVRESLINPDRYDEVVSGYIAVIHAIAEFEPVTLLVNKRDQPSVQSLFFHEDSIDWLVIEHDDAWLRDNGPTFVVNDKGEVAGVNWRFNGWGKKYAPWELDDQLSRKLLERYQWKCFDAPILLEGGSIHVDGEGTLLTTEQCLLHPHRNPSYSRTKIEELLKNYLHVQKIIWLRKGIDGDETDGHIDNLASFVAPGKVMMQVCDDPDDPNYQVTQENWAILEKEVDAKGRKLEIIPVLQPPKMMEHGKRLPLSYLNFSFVNGGIILPLFGGRAQETDQEAYQVFRRTFPNRKIRVVDGMSLIREGGNVHCVTLPLPLVDREGGWRDEEGESSSDSDALFPSSSA